jgi:hypothetical protein
MTFITNRPYGGPTAAQISMNFHDAGIAQAVQSAVDALSTASGAQQAAAILNLQQEMQAMQNLGNPELSGFGSDVSTMLGIYGNNTTISVVGYPLFINDGTPNHQLNYAQYATNGNINITTGNVLEDLVIQQTCGGLTTGAIAAHMSNSIVLTPNATATQALQDLMKKYGL